MFIRRGLAKKKRGKGVARKIVWGPLSTKTHLLTDRKFAKALKPDDNKTELFNLTADTLSGLFRNRQKVLLITRQETVLSNRAVDLQCLQPCYKEEEGDRIFLRAMEQSQLGFKRLMIVTVDTDVVVIALYVYWDLNVNVLWINFSTEKNRRWLPIHSYGELFGESERRAVIFWYA